MSIIFMPMMFLRSLMHLHLTFSGLVCRLALWGQQEPCPFTTRLRVLKLESTMVCNKRHHLVMRGHKVGTAMLRDYDCATGIRQARGLVPVPALNETIKEARSKGIAGPQDIAHLDGKAWHVNLRERASV